MNKKVILIPTKDCESKRCPFQVQLKLNGVGGLRRCNPECMAWVVVTKGESREDHSGGGEMIRQLAYDYGVKAERRGPHGSTGTWDIPELGYCKRLWPALDVISSTDYMRSK